MKSLLSVVLFAGLIGAGCESGPAVRRVELPHSSPYTQNRPPAPVPRPVSLPSHIPEVSPVPEPSPKPLHATPAPQPALVTPAEVLSAKVVSYNEAGRFVLLSFPVDHMPAFERVLAVHRDGKKIGEVKITGPRREQNIVADLISGEAQPGDDVRDQ